MNSSKTIIITGANGLVGKNLVHYFLERGYLVRALQRKPAENLKARNNLSFHSYSLDRAPDENLFKDGGTIIHAAYQPYSLKNKNADELNYSGTMKLVQLARKYNCKFIYLSTFSAHEDAESHYGKSKWEIEKSLDLSKDLILRLGLVMAEGGLASQMADLISKAPAIPLIGGGSQPLQTLHIDDLCVCLETAVNDRSIVGRYDLAEATPTTMKEFYNKIFSSINKPARFISVPLSLVLLAVKTIEMFGIELSINSENALGLKHMRFFSTDESTRKFNLRFRTLNDSINQVLKKAA